MVCEPALAFCARDDLGEYLLLGKGEGDRRKKRDSVIRRHGGVDWGDLSGWWVAGAKSLYTGSFLK